LDGAAAGRRLFPQSLEYLQCNFLNATADGVIKSNAVHGAYNALGGNEIFVGFV
jgi:hypothetical protein